MNAIRGSTHSKYEGLLSIEPPNIVFRPIELNPEDIPTSNGQRSAWGLRFLIVFCTGVAATLVWSGDAAREMITNSYQLFAPRPALTAQNTRLPDVSAPAAPFAERLNGISFDFDAAGQNDKITITPTTATSIGQAHPARAGVTVESQGDAASSQPTVALNIKPTEAKPPEMLSKKGKPLASCFASASAVLQNNPEGWPTWTLKAPGHEGTMCWYAAARPRGSDHRRERVARKEIIGMTENGLPPPPALRPQGWTFGLP